MKKIYEVRSKKINLLFDAVKPTVLSNVITEIVKAFPKIHVYLHSDDFKIELSLSYFLSIVSNPELELEKVKVFLNKFDSSEDWITKEI